MDLAGSLVLLALLGVVIVTYAGHAALFGSPRYERVAKDEGSVLLGTGPMNVGYWALEKVGTVCVRLRIGANAISWSSLFFGAVGAGLFAVGHFGIGALFAAACASCDALDGMVARKTGTASLAGEVLDASIDRAVEFLLLGGIAVAWRTSTPRLSLALLALLGSFMVSYATAKAEAMQVEPPRGAMRRTERCVYLLLGAALTPLATLLAARQAPLLGPLAGVPGELQLLCAVALIGVVANTSAARRLGRVAALVRLRNVPPKSPEPVSTHSEAPLRGHAPHHPARVAG